MVRVDRDRAVVGGVYGHRRETWWVDSNDADWGPGRVKDVVAGLELPMRGPTTRSWNGELITDQFPFLRWKGDHEPPVAGPHRLVESLVDQL
jgi:hypothetical protein